LDYFLKLFAADKAGLYFLFGSSGLALFWNALLVKWQLEHYGLMNSALIVTFASDVVALLVVNYGHRCRNQMENENKTEYNGSLTSGSAFQVLVEHEKQYNGSLTRCAAYLKERSTSSASMEDVQAAPAVLLPEDVLWKTLPWHPLTFWQHFAPLSNCVAVVTHIFFWLSITAVSFVPGVALGRTWEFARTGAKWLLLDLQSIGFEESPVGFIGIFGGAFTMSMLFVVNAIYFIHFPDCAGRHPIPIKSAKQTNKLARGINLCLSPVVNWMYMGLISVFVRGLLCTDAGLLVADEEVKCFQDWHIWMIPFSFMGICCLQTAVVLTRPLFQAHEWESTVTFKIDTHFHIDEKDKALKNEKRNVEKKREENKSMVENLENKAYLTRSEEDYKKYEEKKKEMDDQKEYDEGCLIQKEEIWTAERKSIKLSTKTALEYLGQNFHYWTALGPHLEMKKEAQVALAKIKSQEEKDVGYAKERKKEMANKSSLASSFLPEWGISENTDKDFAGSNPMPSEHRQNGGTSYAITQIIRLDGF
jgi:hypothetical protein